MSKRLAKSFEEFILDRQVSFDEEVLASWKPLGEFKEIVCVGEQKGCWVCGHLDHCGLNLGHLNGEDMWVCDGCGVRMGILEP